MLSVWHHSPATPWHDCRCLTLLHTITSIHTSTPTSTSISRILSTKVCARFRSSESQEAATPGVPTSERPLGKPSPVVWVGDNTSGLSWPSEPGLGIGTGLPKENASLPTVGWGGAGWRAGLLLALNLWPGKAQLCPLGTEFLKVQSRGSCGKTEAEADTAGTHSLQSFMELVMREAGYVSKKWGSVEIRGLL